MLETIIIVLLIFWLLGVFAFHVTTSMIHVLIVIVLVLVILRLLKGKITL